MSDVEISVRFYEDRSGHGEMDRIGPTACLRDRIGYQAAGLTEPLLAAGISLLTSVNRTAAQC